MSYRNSTDFLVDEWEYKGLTLAVTEDDDGEVRKYSHYVVDGDVTRSAPLSAYNGSREIVEAWVDSGFPASRKIGPYRLEDLK